MTDQLRSDPTGLFFVKFVLRLIEEHNVSSAEYKTTVGMSSR